jgi:ubiquinone/menaquinone biosynthesis C-methylase UbiE
MNQPQERVAVFAPQVFEVATLEQAKGITVTAEYGMSSEERWRKETPYLVADVGSRLEIDAETCVLDYGCGTGRIAKGLIEQFGCRVIGVDASRAMRDLAPTYVLSERFNVWSPEVLEQMIAKGFQIDCAISLWVIQHVLDPKQVINQLAAVVRPGGRLYALNQKTRCVPSDRGWVNDGFDVWTALADAFIEDERYSLPDSVVPAGLLEQSLIQVLKRGG